MHTFFFHILLKLKLECILELTVSLYLSNYASICLPIHLSVWQPVDPYGNCLHFKVCPSPSAQFSCSIVSDSLRLHGLQHGVLSIISSWSLIKFMSIKLVMHQTISTAPAISIRRDFLFQRGSEPIALEKPYSGDAHCPSLPRWAVSPCQISPLILTLLELFALPDYKCYCP